MKKDPLCLFSSFILLVIQNTTRIQYNTPTCSSVACTKTKTCFFPPSLKPVVPKKPKRSVPVSSSVDREQSHREASRVSAVTPLSREASDVMPTPAVRKTDVRKETQPNGSEVTTTIVEFTDQVSWIYSREML